MPRSRGGGLGLVRARVRVPGIYADLLQRERERAERSRRVLADPKDPGAGVFRRSTRLLDALEAGEAVVVGAWQLSSRRAGEIYPARYVSVPAHLRPGNCPGAWWRVSSDDVVERTVSLVVERPGAVRDFHNDSKDCR